MPHPSCFFFFFFNDTATTEIYTLSLHDALPIVGTLSKAIGAMGGYVCGSRDLIGFLYLRAPPFLFSTSPPPATAPAWQAAFALVGSPEGAELGEKLWGKTEMVQAQLQESRFQV